ncbi:MAG TPA: hypothetical protein PK280_01745 [Planctomycetota bacterium]|nr:hypothetical protein [Planctomycetota bacterium]
MSVITPLLSEKEKARYLEAARLGGRWLVNNQNAPGQTWGGVRHSADEGRFIYEYFPATGDCRGMGVWGQALAVCGLYALAKVPNPDGADFRAAAELGTGYLLSLQFLDSRRPKGYGGFREQTPQQAWSYPRDGATGCFALAQLYRETGKAEFLERANLFCEWYRRHGSNAAGWPHDYFDFETGEGSCKIPGDWQTGGSLAYYYTAQAAKDRHWLEEGFRPAMEQLLTIGDPTDAGYHPHLWHGECRITTGNGDFSNVALVAAYLAFEDERYLKLLRRRLDLLLGMQDADGSLPNYGSTFVFALDALDFLELVKARRLPDKTERLVDGLLRAARFGLTLQETGLRDRRAYGGIYGQSSFGVSPDRVHQRDTNYGMHLYLRLAGHEAPVVSAFGW